MKKIILPLLAASMLLPSCASIVSHSQWPLDITSNPTGAGISITNRAGKQVFTGKTPSTVTLESSAGFFKREEYKIKFEMEGYPSQELTVHAKVNGWYWGNLLFGGVIGFLIVDPASGAMYKLDSKSINAEMGVRTAQSGKRELRILNYADITPEMKAKLVRIN